MIITLVGASAVDARGRVHGQRVPPNEATALKDVDFSLNELKDGGLELARKRLAKDPAYFGTMMMYQGMAAGMVRGMALRLVSSNEPSIVRQ